MTLELRFPVNPELPVLDDECLAAMPAIALHFLFFPLFVNNNNQTVAERVSTTSIASSPRVTLDSLLTHTLRSSIMAPSNQSAAPTQSAAPKNGVKKKASNKSSASNTVCSKLLPIRICALTDALCSGSPKLALLGRCSRICRRSNA